MTAADTLTAAAWMEPCSSSGSFDMCAALFQRSRRCLNTVALCCAVLCLAAPAQTGEPLCPAKRRKWCDVPKNLDGLTLSPDHVYTFHIWQHLIDFSTYKLSVGNFMNIDLAAVLNGQPLQLTVFDTQVWAGQGERKKYFSLRHTRAAGLDSSSERVQLQNNSDKQPAGVLTGNFCLN